MRSVDVDRYGKAACWSASCREDTAPRLQGLPGRLLRAEERFSVGQRRQGRIARRRQQKRRQRAAERPWRRFPY